MYARRVSLTLKPNSRAEFTNLLETEIIPVLRKQKGFRDEITVIAPERSEAVGTTFWDTKADAQAYNTTGYPELLKTLLPVVEGTPKVETFEVANSTCHKIAAAQTV